MSTLSKVFVVLVLLASIVFAMTSIARLATEKKYREMYEGEQAKVTAAEAKAKDAAEKLRLEQDAHVQDKTADKATIDTGNRQVTDLQTKFKSTADELANIKGELSTNTANLAAVNASLKLATDQVKQLIKERDDAVKRASDAEEARLDAEQKFADAVNQIKNLKDKAKGLEEENTRLLTESKRLNGLVQLARDRGFLSEAEVTTVQTPTTPPPIIRGVVTNVQRQPNNEIWVEVNVGANSLVKDGTRFIIYGGGEYKGDVRVQKVFPDSSIGVLMQAGAKEVAKGDKATTQLEVKP